MDHHFHASMKHVSPSPDLQWNYDANSFNNWLMQTIRVIGFSIVNYSSLMQHIAGWAISDTAKPWHEAVTNYTWQHKRLSKTQVEKGVTFWPMTKIHGYQWPIAWCVRVAYGNITRCPMCNMASPPKRYPLSPNPLFVLEERKGDFWPNVYPAK